MWVLIIVGYYKIHSIKSDHLDRKIMAKLKSYPFISASDKESLIKGWQSKIKIYLYSNNNEIQLFIRLLPMLGLLGTIDGMIECFSKLTDNSIMTAVSEGISHAMLTTLAGLLTALSGMYLAYHLKQQQNKLINQLQYIAEQHEN